MPLLRAAFGFPEFRPGQAEAVESLLAGGHTLVVMPTGAGKSLVYQLYAVSRPGVTLVISPLISLMQDQVNTLARRNIAATYINSSISSLEQSQRLDAMAAGQYRLVYVAPERLRSTTFQQALARTELGLLAIDEAHCISQWGHDFRPDYLHIAAARSRWGNPLTAALTATATPTVRDDIMKLLGLPRATQIVTGFNRPNLTFKVRYCRDVPAKLRALMELVKTLDSGAAIIYAGTRRDAEEVAQFMTEAVGESAGFYHAGMPPDAREKAQNEFMRGRTRLVVATTAFGMGIDRADVRLVAHYSIPGSLEAYYQEAGRAGRDGSPAQATLLYCPEDRSLQEYFIDNSVLTARDVHVLHSALGEEAWLSNSDLSLATGLPEISVRVGLSLLESIGAAQIAGTDGPRALVHRGPMSEGALRAALGQAETRLDHRRAQLTKMVAYAESDSCRRRIILQHFGDPGDASAPVCCDNCLATGSGQPQSRPKGPAQLTPENKTALLILDSVNSLKWPVGRGKIAKLLKGSRSADVAMFGYDKNPRHGKLSAFSQSEIEGMIDQLIETGYLKLTGGRLPVLGLTPRGGNALTSRAAVPLTFPRQLMRSALKKRRPQSYRITYTVELTWEMYQQGLSPAAVADQRGLTQSTIYSHLARLISEDRLDVWSLLPQARVAAIRDAIAHAGKATSLMAIKKRLPDDFVYGEIECVMAADGVVRADVPSTTNPQPATSGDPVASYLSKSHPRPLAGPWTEGWALGFHSSFAGADWNRSGVGDLTYRLKYRSDRSALEPLVEEAVALCSQHPALSEVGAIVPVPPSVQREVDPVSLFCQALAKGLNLPVLACVSRTRTTQPQKEMRTLAQKRANVSGAFAVSGSVVNRRVLLVDDLYDSGATLEEVAKALAQAGAASIRVLTLTRTIHSDA